MSGTVPRCPYCRAAYFNCKTDARGLCVKRPKDKVVYLTRRAPLDEFVDVARSHTAFTNSTGTFHGKPVSPLEAARIASMVADDRVRFALIMDEPDYVIFADSRPLVWHSTIRGTDSRALPPNPERWEWVLAPNDRNSYYRAHFRIAETVVTTLNGELDNVHP